MTRSSRFSIGIAITKEVKKIAVTRKKEVSFILIECACKVVFVFVYERKAKIDSRRAFYMKIERNVDPLFIDI